LEGIDGCGKSTQATLLQDKLKKNKIPFISIREPGGTAAGESIRQILLQTGYSLTAEAELLLYMAARSELSRQVITPALISGKIVLCDRFTDSTIAYQGYGSGIELQWINALNWKATGGRLPDLTFLLDLSVEEAALRRGSAADRMEKKDFYYHQRVHQGYLAIARREPERVMVFDAAVQAEIICSNIWQTLSKFIDNRTKMGSKHEF